MTSIDENLYSRQIAVYGKKSMQSLANAKIGVLGFNTCALELCKNLILTGISEIHILSNHVITNQDLSSNYYINQYDIGKKISTIRNKLSELNPYVNVQIDNSENDCGSLINKCDVIVLVNNNIQTVYKINDECRKNSKPFIWINYYGLMGNVFCDFGNEFIVSNINGEEELSSLLQTISPEGIFQCVESEPCKLSVGDKIVVSDVKGLNINDREFTIGKKIDMYNFTVEENDCDWSSYINGGQITEVKQPVKLHFKRLKECIDEPRIENKWIDNSLEELHKCFVDLQNHLNSNFIPKNWSNELKCNSEYKYKHYFENTCQGQFLPVCSVVGSYAAQEVIKAVTHKCKPTEQWYYFNCYDILPDNFTLIGKKYSLKNDRYDGLRVIFGNDLVEQFQNQFP